METVTRKQRSNVARLGMLRQWTLNAALRLVKVGTGDMRSDILTKPVLPAKQFQRLARLVLIGDAEARERACSGRGVGGGLRRRGLSQRG